MRAINSNFLIGLTMRLVAKVIGLTLMAMVLIGALGSAARANVVGQEGLNNRLVRMLHQVSSHFGAEVSEVRNQ